jgi:copper transport protein
MNRGGAVGRLLAAAFAMAAAALVPALALAAVALVPAAAALLLPAAAAAHSSLESSSPASGESVATSPRRIVLTFSEAPDPKLSLIKVLDSEGAVVPGVSAAQAVTGDKESLEVVPDKPLADGTYTVNWRAVSTVDGHVDDGAFAFGVGQAAGDVLVVELVHTSPWASALAGVGRWLLYAALAVFIGAASTSLFAYGGSLPRGGVAVLRAAAAAGVVALALLTWGEKMLVGARTLLPLFQTRQGGFLLALGVALAVCILAVVLVDLWPGRWSLWVLAAAGAAAVLVHVAAGHAASPSPVWFLNIAVQWVHMTAVGVWVGGLFWLLLGFRGRGHDERAAAVGVFTRIATWPLVVVLATGLLRAVSEVGSVGALFDTRYGVTLIIKVALVAFLAGLGALNHFFWVPALREEGAGTERSAGGPDTPGGRGERRFGLNSRGELAVALAVLAATAVLSGLAPAGSAAAVQSAAEDRQGQVTASGSDYATTVRVELTLRPGRAGQNAYVLWADDYDTGDPLAGVTSVRLECAPPAGSSSSPVRVDLEPAPDGSWTGAGLDFSVAGRWEVVVYVQRKSAGTTVDLEVPVRQAQ